jgi:hypothetical protein
MKKICSMLVLMTCLGVFGAVERVDYTETGSNVQKRQFAGENNGFSVAGSSFVAFGVAPMVEWPSADYEIKGFRLNLFLADHMDVYGLDIGVLGNFVEREIGGVQIAGVFNAVGESGGTLQFAILCNHCKGDFAGAQFGFVNITEKGRGFQFGIINRANILDGVQLGVINYNASSSLPIAPFFNCAF